MKEAYYFSHDSNASQDEKILNLRADCGWEGYGIYWAIIERLRDTEGHRYTLTSIKGLAASLGVKTVTITEIIKNYGLFESDGDYFWSNSLINRMKIVEDKRLQAKEAGKRSAQTRFPKNEVNENQTTVQRQFNDRSTTVQNSFNENQTDVQQGKERKGNNEILKGNETTTTTTTAREKLFDFFRKNVPSDQNPEKEAEKFIALNDIKKWEVVGGWENWEDAAKLYILRIEDKPTKTNATNGRSSNIQPSGYAESIANADRIIESIARSQ
jgi:hypothetical protein